MEVAQTQAGWVSAGPPCHGLPFVVWLIFFLSTDFLSVFGRRGWSIYSSEQRNKHLLGVRWYFHKESRVGPLGLGSNDPGSRVRVRTKRDRWSCSMEAASLLGRFGVSSPSRYCHWIIQKGEERLSGQKRLSYVDYNRYWPGKKWEGAWCLQTYDEKAHYLRF